MKQFFYLGSISYNVRESTKMHKDTQLFEDAS